MARYRRTFSRTASSSRACCKTASKLMTASLVNSRRDFAPAAFSKSLAARAMTGNGFRAIADADPPILKSRQLLFGSNREGLNADPEPSHGLQIERPDDPDMRDQRERNGERKCRSVFNCNRRNRRALQVSRGQKQEHHANSPARDEPHSRTRRRKARRIPTSQREAEDDNAALER